LISDASLPFAARQLVVDEISGAFRDQMPRSTVFELVDEPGYDVFLVRGLLLDVVSRVPPEPPGRTTIYLDRVGDATLVLEVRDSMGDAHLRQGGRSTARETELSDGGTRR
jgi:hypothetical protein